MNGLLTHLESDARLLTNLQYHGIGLGGGINRMFKGFVTDQRLFLESTDFERNNNYMNTGIFTSSERIGISPFYGVFYTIRAGVIYILDKEANVISQFPTYSNNSGGVSNIDWKGNGLLATDRMLYHIYPNGTLKNQRQVNIESSSNQGEYHSLSALNKKDVFVYSLNKQGGSRVGVLCKLSTLEVLNDKLYTFIQRDKSVFSKDGRLITYDEPYGLVKVHTLDYTTYEITDTKTFNTNINSSIGIWIGMNKKGELMFHDRGNKKVYSLNIDTGDMTTITNLVVMSNTVVINDFDNNYYYAYNNYNAQQVILIKVSDGSIYKTINLSSNGSPYPLQLRGKMPICEKFF